MLWFTLLTLCDFPELVLRDPSCHVGYFEVLLDYSFLVVAAFPVVVTHFFWWYSYVLSYSIRRISSVILVFFRFSWAAVWLVSDHSLLQKQRLVVLFRRASSPEVMRYLVTNQGRMRRLVNRYHRRLTSLLIVASVPLPLLSFLPWPPSLFLPLIFKIRSLLICNWLYMLLHVILSLSSLGLANLFTFLFLLLFQPPLAHISCVIVEDCVDYKLHKTCYEAPYVRGPVLVTAEHGNAGYSHSKKGNVPYDRDDVGALPCQDVTP